MKDLGIIVVLLGVLSLVLYFVKMPVNWLLVLGLSLEAAGILMYILINRFSKKC